MMARFDGKVVVVTGAASGIGRATAIRLAEEGGQVMACDWDLERVTETVQLITDAGGQARALKTDVSNYDACGELIAAAVAWGGKLDVLVNVAGVGGFVHTTEETPENFARTLGVNLHGPFNTARHALPHLLESQGNIVNVASIAGLEAHPYAAAYCASKGGVVMLTKALAMEYASRQVRVNAVCPGGIKTPFIKNFKPMEGSDVTLMMRMMSIIGRYGQPSEVSSAIAFLGSDEASFITGEVMRVDGGATL
jgi:NAD(P)-dependent dehydrogenase (short-subunit alcohol dehydrogenase family)